MAKAPGITSLIRQAGQEIRRTGGDDQGDGRFNVLDYVEQPWGLNMHLYPAQRFIVKLYYGIPLDGVNKTIPITDMFNTKVLRTLTEMEYLQYLYDDGRCNIREYDHPRRELILVIGRRSGKTELSGLFASYEIYRLLNLGNPQAYYGLPEGNKIQLISVGTDKDQAGILFNNVTSHLNRCDYFRPFIANNTLSYIQFRTPTDIERYGPNVRHRDGKFVSFNGKASIKVTFKSCIAKGLRGPGNIVIILDEMAHFQAEGQSSAKEIYDAITPSAATYSPKDPVTGAPIGSVESRIICISSPMGKDGKFYELYDLAMRGGPGSDNMLVIQAPTWEINPTVESSYYKQKYHADPTTFSVEHGARFSSQVSGWIERAQDLEACIDPAARPKLRGIPRYPYHMGVDVGLVGDGTAVAITHLEGDVIHLDYHEVWSAGVDWKTSNPHLGNDYPTKYAMGLESVERLDFDEIALWIQALAKRFHIADGLFDRWNGIPLEQSLHKMGLKQFTSMFFTRDVSSKMYQTAKLLIYDERLKLYDYPKPEEGKRHSPLVTELLDLQAQHLSKNLVLVEAPKIGGAHDDLADALVRSIWLASERVINQKYVSSGVGGVHRPTAAVSPTVAHYQLTRMRRHGPDPRRGYSALRRSR